MASEEVLTEFPVRIEVDGLRVDVELLTDADRGKFISLVPVNCKLEGECPGDYYPVPDTE